MQEIKTVTGASVERYLRIIKNVTQMYFFGDATNLFRHESRSIENLSCEVLIARYDGVYRPEISCLDYTEYVELY